MSEDTVSEEYEIALDGLGIPHIRQGSDAGIATDRDGAKFYYPQPQAIDILELPGTEADNLSVHYEGKDVVLHKAYEYVTSRLTPSSEDRLSNSHHPFVSGNQGELGAASAL